ncbi:hypothetical protein AO442_000657 [Nakaseomyces glabratus]|nr:hypothetical protein AO443_000658 [Nakaseomyces glabratus]KTB26970.1 hypothetical protein AO442_000657 [Nakaseomyces glabratus]
MNTAPYATVSTKRQSRFTHKIQYPRIAPKPYRENNWPDLALGRIFYVEAILKNVFTRPHCSFLKPIATRYIERPRDYGAL